MELVSLKKGKRHVLSAIQTPLPNIGGQTFFFTLCKQVIPQDRLYRRRDEGIEYECDCAACLKKLKRLDASLGKQASK